jgi:hypothetical protein
MVGELRIGLKERKRCKNYVKHINSEGKNKLKGKF